MYYRGKVLKNTASFCGRGRFIKLRVERDPYCVGVSKPQCQTLTTYEHGIRVYERGGVCVVGEFVLAYLDHFNSFTPIIQVVASSPI